MNAKKITVMALLTTTVLLSGCGGGSDSNGNIVKYEYRAGAASPRLSDLISEITILPMETTDQSLFAGENQLFIANGEYYVIEDEVNKTILRFNGNGEFLNRIGWSGRGYSEYLNISSAYAVGERIEIYCGFNGTVYSFSLDGRFISKNELELQVSQVAPAADGGYWGYTGFGNGRLPERVVKMDSQGSITDKFLPSDAIIINMSEWVNPLIINGNELLIREAYVNVVSSIDRDGNVGEKYVFDFGRYSIPDSYFKQSDPFKAAFALIESDFAALHSLFEDGRRTVVQVMFQFGRSQTEPVLVTGFRSGNEWQWINSGNQFTNPTYLTTSVRGLIGNTLVLLMDNDQIKSLAAEYPALVKNISALDGAVYDANPSILLCKLK